MADARMPESFYELASSMLPPEREIGPQGGRPLIRHYTVLKVIWFVLVTGCRWKDVPHEMGCCGETARTRLQAWERAGLWDELHKLLLTMLRQSERTALGDGDHRLDAGARVWRRRGHRSEPGRSPEKRDEIHAAGRSRRRAAGDSRGAGQSQRPVGDSADGRRRFRPCRQARAVRDASRRAVRRRGLRQRSHAEPSPLAGHRAAHSATATASTAVTWAECVGWWSERSVGSKVCAACEFATTDRLPSIDAWTSIAAAVVCLNIFLKPTAY